ncbi:MAG: hypothetical protein IPM63_11225 [Acidobacteriota bacterium]|nr:MAG: hypothetical protein IPM63_11225 [Acidobacteriota bacterium]
MRSIRLAMLPMTFLALAGLAGAQEVSPDGKTLAEVQAYVKEARDFVEKQGEPHLIFADVSDYNEGSKPLWKKYSSMIDFQNAGEEIESYTVAYVWLKEGKVIGVNFTYSSPSGDWAHYAEHVFRPDGSIAEIRKELRTFMGDVIVIRTTVFDPSGKELKVSKEFLDLNTQKPVPPTENFQDVDIPVYKKAGDLPFAGQL